MVFTKESKKQPNLLGENNGSIKTSDIPMVRYAWEVHWGKRCDVTQVIWAGCSLTLTSKSKYTLSLEKTAVKCWIMLAKKKKKQILHTKDGSLWPASSLFSTRLFCKYLFVWQRDSSLIPCHRSKKWWCPLKASQKLQNNLSYPSKNVHGF